MPSFYEKSLEQQISILWNLGKNIHISQVCSLNCVKIEIQPGAALAKGNNFLFQYRQTK